MNRELPYRKLLLPNGLTVFLVNIKTVKTFYASLYVKVGAVNENRKNNGISHFLEHFIHQGTKNYKSFELFSEAIEFEGMYQNAQSGRFSTVYYVDSPFEKGEKALDFLYELVFLPTLPASRLNHVKKIVLSEYFGYWSEPQNKFKQKMFLGRMKGENVYQYDSLGRPETIQSFTREKLLVWKNKYYQPANMILSVAGNFNQRKMMTKIKNSFGKKKSIGKIEKPSRLKITYSDFLTYYQKEKSNQIRFLLTFPTFGFKEVKMRKLLQLGLLNFIVGDSPSSRLAKLLRENNNLVYSVGSDTVSFPFMGEFIIGGSVAKENLFFSMQLIKKELGKVKNNGVQKKETQKAKNLYRRNVVCFNFETPLQITDWVVGEELAGRKIRLPEEYMRMVKKISKEEIGYLAQEIFDFSKINIGFMGNLKKDEVEKATSVFK